MNPLDMKIVAADLGRAYGLAADAVDGFNEKLAEAAERCRFRTKWTQARYLRPMFFFGYGDTCYEVVSRSNKGTIGAVSCDSERYIVISGNRLVRVLTGAS